MRNPFDVCESLDLRPVILKDRIAVLLDLALHQDFETGAVKAKIEPTNAGEER